MSALPKLFPTDPATQEVTEAYRLCLELEVSNYSPAKTDTNKESPYTGTIAARVLGYMLIYAPSPSGREKLANDINRCQNPAELYELAICFKFFCFRCCTLDLTVYCDLSDKFKSALEKSVRLHQAICYPHLLSMQMCKI
jgi:hypothetical protein